MSTDLSDHGQAPANQIWRAPRGTLLLRLGLELGLRLRYTQILLQKQERINYIPLMDSGGQYAGVLRFVTGSYSTAHSLTSACYIQQRLSLLGTDEATRSLKDIHAQRDID